MATVTKEFRADFEKWSAAKIRDGEFTPEEIVGLKDLIRKDLAPGPDQIRKGMMVTTEDGRRVHFTIDDHEERASLWTTFFRDEARLC